MPSESDPVGKVLAGKYRIESLLKRGGMGAVYRATHLMLHKPIAIKLIKPELVPRETRSVVFTERRRRRANSITRTS